MSYLQSVLQPGETLLYESRISWTTFLPGLILFIAAFIAFFILRALIPTPSWPSIAIGLILLALSLFMLFRAWFERCRDDAKVSADPLIKRAMGG